MRTYAPALLIALLASAGLIWGFGVDAVESGPSSEVLGADSTRGRVVLEGRVGATAVQVGSGRGALRRGGATGDADDAEFPVTVSVCTTKGEPIPGARVEARPLYADSDAWSAAGSTDGAGLCRLPVASFPCTVLARASGFALESASLRRAEDCAFVLDRAGGVSGLVLDAASGQPVAGALVHAIEGEGRHSERCPMHAPTCVSGPDGRYRLEGMHAGESTVLALGGGWASVEIIAIDCASGYDPLAVTLDEGGSVVRDLAVVPAGRVCGTLRTKQGVPIVGAEISVRVVDSRHGGCGEVHGGQDYTFVPELPPVVTDGGGCFALESLAPNLRHRIGATHEDYRRVFTRAQAASGETVQVEMTAKELPAAWHVRLEVRDRATGKPIAGVPVGESETDAGGVALAGPFRSNAWFRIRAEGYRQDYLNLQPPKEGQPLTRKAVVSLVPCAALAGLVQTPEGVPAARAIVTIGVRSEAARRHYDRPTRYTDRDGRFRFTERDTRDPTVPLHATWKHEGLAYEAFARAAPGDTEIRLQLRPVAVADALQPRTLEVRGPDGRPVPKASGSLHTLRPITVRGRPRFRSATHFARVEDGRLLVAPPTTPFEVELWDARDGWGQPIATGPVALGPFESTAELPAILVLPPSRRIRGCVLGDDGVPVAGLVVTAFVKREPWPGTDVAPPSRQHARSRSDAAGRFSLERLGDIPYTLRVATPAQWRFESHPPVRGGASGVELTVARNFDCTITVVDAYGDPVEEARLRLLDAHTRAVEVQGISELGDGQYALTGIVPDEYVLEVRPPHRSTNMLLRRIPRWTPRDTVVRLESPVELSGIVLDDSGRPIPGAEITAAMIEGTESRTRDSCVCGRDGRFRLDGLARGRAKVTVECGEFLPASTFTIGSPQQDVVLRVAKGREMEVTCPLFLPSGAKLAWGLSWYEPRSGRVRKMRGTTRPVEGRFLLRHLPAYGSLDLVVAWRKGGRAAYVPGVGADVRALTVHLAAARCLRGRLYHPDGGTRVPRGQVRVHIGPYSWWGYARSDGSFEVSGLPAGEARFEASAHMDGTKYVAERRVRTDENVEIVLQPLPD